MKPELTNQHPKSPQVIALGETMLMFAPPTHEQIETCNHFRSYIGGSEVNVAVGLERLGIHAGWIGKLPDNALGRKVVNGIREFGVDTNAVVWSEYGRVGTFYVEFGAKPRPTKTVYDRADSAATTLRADELDWDYIAQAKWLHLTGISPALSETCRQSTLDIVMRCRDLGIKVSFDLNYRSKVWSQVQARETWTDILPYTNIIIATEEDYTLLLNKALSYEQALETAYQRFHPDAVVMTRRGDGCAAFDGHMHYAEPTYKLEVVHRIGAGDAFDAGLLYGMIKADLRTGLRYGNAMAIIKMTIPNNLPIIDREDVEHLLSGQRDMLVR